MLTDLRADTDAILHVIPQLTSVMNQTRVYVQENRFMMVDIKTHQRAVDKYILHLSQRVIGITVRIEVLEVRQEVDRILTALELISDAYRRQTDLHQAQRAALEVGHLTEKLLPPGVLEEILQQGISQGYQVVTQLEWYYQYLEVHPIWNDNGNLLYKVELPLLDDVKYIHYKILTFPVPYENEMLSATLDLDEHYGFNTETGGLFFPMFCTGREPAVCRSGPLYDSGNLQCPRSIITGSKSPIDVCTVTIIKGSQSTIITEIDINTYVVTTWGDTIIERCAGESERSTLLKANVYTLTVRPTCSIAGKDWEVKGITEKNLKQRLTQLPITMPVNINITYQIPSDALLNLFPGMSGAELMAVPNVPLDINNPVPGSRQLPSRVQTLARVMVAAILILTLTLLSAVGFYVYRRYQIKVPTGTIPLYIPAPTTAPEIDTELPTEAAP
jgi:hypothetical protein